MVRVDSYRRLSWVQFMGIRRSGLKTEKKRRRKIRNSKINLEELLPLAPDVKKIIDLDAKKKIINWEELQPPLPLPDDVIQLIFSKLPFVNLPNCRLVCKAWNNLVLNNCKFHPDPIYNLFITHISPFRKLSYLDLDPKHLKVINNLASFSFHPDLSSSTYISIINSCNGLLCCSFKCKTTKRPRICCILNPMTNEYLRVPTSNSGVWGIKYDYGLGFSPKTKQYKLARNSYVRDKSTSKFSTLVEIFAFGTTTTSSPQWAPVGFVPFAIETYCAYFNGGLYWAAYESNGMYCLDIEDEKLEEIYLPRPSSVDFLFFGVLDGTLYLSFCVEYEYHVWKME